MSHFFDLPIVSKSLTYESGISQRSLCLVFCGIVMIFVVAMLVIVATPVNASNNHNEQRYWSSGFDTACSGRKKLGETDRGGDLYSRIKDVGYTWTGASGASGYGGANVTNVRTSTGTTSRGAYNNNGEYTLQFGDTYSLSFNVSWSIRKRNRQVWDNNSQRWIWRYTITHYGPKRVDRGCIYWHVVRGGNFSPNPGWARLMLNK